MVPQCLDVRFVAVGFVTVALVSKWCPNAKVYGFVALVPNWCPKAQMYDLLPLLWFRSGALMLGYRICFRCFVQVVPQC